jgi:hypothetical protein
VTTPQDRILLLALEEIVGGREPPDLEARILVRARRPIRRLSRWRIGLAAAALLLLGLAIWAILPPREPGSEPSPRTQLSTEEKLRTRAWVALLRESMQDLDLSNPADVKRLKTMWQARRELLELLAEKPAGWAWVRPLLLPLPEGLESIDVRRQLLEILGRQPGAENDSLILDRIRVDAPAFDDETLLVLSERDCAPARSLLESRVASRPSYPPLALPAAFLALRGDDRGAATMRDFVASRNMIQAKPAVAFACAAGLHRLGDPTVWTKMTAVQRTLADAHLASEDMDAARGIVAALTLVRPAVASKETIRLGDLDLRKRALARRLRSELPTADSIRARLAELVD